MKNQNLKLTELEKEVLAEAFSQGYAFDDMDSKFISYGMGRDWNPEQIKKDRGAISSLEKKGVVSIWIDKSDHNTPYTSVGDGWTKAELLELCEFKRFYPNY